MTNRRIAVAGLALVVVVGLMAVATGVVGSSSGVSSLDTVAAPPVPAVLAPAFSDGPDPFFSLDEQLAAFQIATGDTPSAAEVASGLFGGTAQNTCSPKRLSDFLASHPDRGRAWAQVQGIGFDEVAEFVGSLRAQVLAAPSTVLNHGFDPAVAAAYEVRTTLDRGTAVLVDESGEIRVRCYSGSPMAQRGSGIHPPRCVTDPSLVFTEPGGTDAVRDVSSAVSLTGRITVDESWVQIKWGADDDYVGWTQDTNLQNNLCSLAPATAPTVNPTPASPDPTAAPDPTATASPTATATPTVTAVPVPAATVSPTAIPGPTPTATLVPDEPEEETATPEPATPTATSTTTPDTSQVGCSATDTVIAVGEIAEFSATVDPVGGSATYLFEHGDGSTDDRNPSQASYEAPGSYDVYATVTIDGQEFRQFCATVMVTVTATDVSTDDEAPVPVEVFCEVSATRIRPGETTTFTAASVSLGSLISFVFDHGNGTTGNTNPSNVTYTDRGTYPVTLTVTDTAGTREIPCGTVLVDPLASAPVCPPEAYLGLTEAQALELAASQGCGWRVVARAGTALPVASGERLDRLNFEIDSQGRIIRAYVG